MVQFQLAACMRYALTTHTLVLQHTQIRMTHYAKQNIGVMQICSALRKLLLRPCKLIQFLVPSLVNV